MNKGTRLAAVAGAIVFSVFGALYASQAQQPKEQPYQAMSDQFFNLLQQDKTTDAIDYMFGTNPSFKKVPDQADQLKAQFISLEKLAGPYISHTILVESKVAGIFVYQHYFVAYERQPISVRIKYYKPGATWVVYGLQFDANVAEEIQKAADERLQVGAN